MTATEPTTGRWIDAARYVLEHGFVMVEPDGSWHPPTDRDWHVIGHTEVDEMLATGPTDTTGVLLDAFTASMLVQIHDALNDTNRERFAAMDLLRAVDVGWKLANKGKA